MIWGLIALFDSGAFGDDLFHFPSPYAITLFGSGKLVGVNIDSKDVFSSEKLFDDQAYYQSNSPKNPNSNISSSLAVITSPNSKNIYLGNTAQFIVRTPSEDGVGYLTLGVDVDIFLRRLVFGAHQMAILVHEGQPLSVYSEEGKRLELDSKFNLPFAEMLHQKLGIVSWNEKSYFFMHLQPFPTVDLHFFLLNPEEIQFAWIREFQNSTKEIVDRILFDMHLAGLGALVLAILLVHRISRKITKPIIQLAQATKEVAQGRLDDVQLSLPPLKHQDEVAMLCHSFEEMVKGLKEKEKVKGVLNKVVSTEIAQEILKGNVHLGGEEKKVTVLFADIREFTKMTQNMAPQQVIELLNSCMTKISCSIDQNGGVIDKFVGDEAMALFGAPISKEDAAFKAVLSAVEMQEALKNWNLERVSKGMPAIEMGIGIHTGEMLAGNMGAENRLNYTVIGSNVNLAARLCNAAKRMEILITKDTLNEPFVKDRFIYESMPPITLKGFDKQVEVFSVKGIKR
jgi:class 3 adenylate cyclase/HAMP domain-containing protein